MDKVGVDTKREDMEYASGFDYFILILTLVSIANIILNVVPAVDQSIKSMSLVMDTVACLFFLADFIRNLSRAEKKLAYLKWGWMDLIGSIPFFLFLRFFRLRRASEIVATIRFYGVDESWRRFKLRRADSTLWSSVTVGLLIVWLASIWILRFESDIPTANIQTASDALWWTFVTITTVGYGDKFPITNDGRILAVLVMVVGITFFSVLTSYITTRMRSSRSMDTDSSKGMTHTLEHMISEIEIMKEELKEIKALLQKKDV
jgi:voltage-gated potassium channel